MRLDDDEEEEALRQLRAAFPPGARLDSQRRADTWRIVLASAREHRPDIGFPETTFAWLAAGLVAMEAWLAAHYGLSAGPAGTVSLSAVSAVVLANLVCLPVAALVIVRRKRTWHDRKHTPMNLESIGR
jgi:hypothetical protein